MQTANPADAITEAEALLTQRKLQQACIAFRKAQAMGADADRCCGGLWMTHMLQGDFASAWRQSDDIRQRGAHDPHRFWNGESVDGKRLILRSLHGFGDAVQMFRYLPLLQSRAAHIIVEVPPRLVEIAPCFKGMGQVITWGKDAPAQAPQWDVQIEVMELPYLFRTELQHLPIATHYLSLPQTLRSQINRKMGQSSRPRIGIVWSTGEWNLSRAIPFPLIADLVQDRTFEFWNLQGGSEHDAWNHLPKASNLRDAAELGDGILTLAAAIDQMDLIITPDTLAAHLAGALGKPAWVLLQHAADWRWMCDRHDTPWYPSLQLFRQPGEGDWHGAMLQIQRELARWRQKAA